MTGHQDLSSVAPFAHTRLLALIFPPSPSTKSYPSFPNPPDGHGTTHALPGSQLCSCQLAYQDTHMEGPLLLYKVLLLSLQPLYYWKVN